MYDLWFCNRTKVLSFNNHKKAWKRNGIHPFVAFECNGAKRKRGDDCFSVRIVIGYISIYYINFDLQRRYRNGYQYD